MALLMFRTFGVIIVSFIVLIMYVLHRKKNGKFIKRKAVNEEEKICVQSSCSSLVTRIYAKSIVPDTFLTGDIQSEFCQLMK
jgi:acyl-CoA synthetase (AMP-forming)/AMP-acid ligase II